MWINQNFLLQEDLNIEGRLDVRFESLREMGSVWIQMETSGQVSLADIICLFITSRCHRR